jgi:pimeloyl-ACP methyl ester carboxylesterase
MRPETYLPLANLLADRVRVVIPAIFECPGRWTYESALECLELTLDELDLEDFSLLGHSFGGGLELGTAARQPDRVVECVFADTLGVREGLTLAREATHNPLGILRMATPPAMRAFFLSLATHPIRMAESAAWGFASHRRAEIDDVVRDGIPCYVLWAESDTLLARSDGQEFARRLHATFTVVQRLPGYGPIDHDWMFDDPELFAEHLERLGLHVLSGNPIAASRIGGRGGPGVGPPHIVRSSRP